MSETTDNTSSTQAPAAPSSSWKLPDGIEDHIEAGKNSLSHFDAGPFSLTFLWHSHFLNSLSGLLKSVIGVSAGGVVGLIMFRSGKGMRGASVATGVGIAVGSTYERMMAQYGSK
jgi:hypothetical protein